MASDDIVALTQYRGVARTKIAFTSDRDATRASSAAKELYIVDYDGFNREADHRQQLAQHPARLEPRRALPRLRLLPPGQPRHLRRAGSSRGAATTSRRATARPSRPSFSPDGKRIAYASNQVREHGDLGRRTRTAAARAASPTSAGCDTAPTWSPTGQEIAFTSDRGGHAPDLR